MAVTEWIEHAGPRPGLVNDRREREYTRVFRAVVSRATDGPEVLRLWPECPRPWSVYVSASGFVDPGSWCREVRFDPDPNDPYTWTVVASYSSRVERPDINLIENPLLRPSDISWGTTKEMIPAIFDSEGTPIRNSAGELFDPPVERPKTTMVLRIGKNLATFDAKLAREYEDTLNDAAFFTFEPGQVLCKTIAAKREFENGILFWRVDYEFHIREAHIQGDDVAVDDPMGLRQYAWATFVLDRGFHRLDGSGKLVPILIHGQPAASPVLLDGAGAPMNIPGQASGDPVYRMFQLYPSKPFSRLNVP